MLAERIRRLAGSERAARHVGFWWGLAEGVFFFIVPDVYIGFATLFALRAGAIAWLFSVLGSLVAIPILYGLTVGLGLDYLAFLESIPGISATMIAAVSAALADGGLPYTPLLVLGGVPLKVYGTVASSLGISFLSVLVWTAFARVVRIAPTYALAAGMRWLFGRHVDGHPERWLLAWSLGWVVFYVFYFTAKAG